MHLEIGFCLEIGSNHIFNPVYNRKTLMRKKTSILEIACFTYEQLFHPVQCIACRICQCSSRDRLVLPKVTGILSIAYQLHYLWGIKCFGNGTRQFSTCVSVWKFTRTSLLTLYNVHFRKDISSLESVFSVSGNCFVSTTVSVSFSGEDFGVASTSW